MLTLCHSLSRLIVNKAAAASDKDVTTLDCIMCHGLYIHLCDCACKACTVILHMRPTTECAMAIVEYVRSRLCHAHVEAFTL